MPGLRVTPLNPGSCTIRTKTDTDHMPPIAPPATSVQCRGHGGLRSLQRLSVTEVAFARFADPATHRRGFDGKPGRGRSGEREWPPKQSHLTLPPHRTVGCGIGFCASRRRSVMRKWVIGTEGRHEKRSSASEKARSWGDGEPFVPRRMRRRYQSFIGQSA